ncbi:DEAD/DEAH box helicase [Candidatus Woesearchaeota archaeon]|jgi:Fanconi anemia group M protein|nr:DEAD/DEAH box helicase [Candidatus Woesearchaeota archaeon]
MYKIIGFQAREYQDSIFNSSKTQNTLVCLPTGTGKTKLAILLLIERLNKFPESNIIVISPSKPLSSQICEEIKSNTDIPKNQINLLTGTIKPEERSKIFSNSKVIVATPQTIQFDVENDRISLKNTSLLVIDECHRSKEKFANTIVAREYNKYANEKLILALTASPGATKEKVSEVCSNLFIENIELRTEIDKDLAIHIQKKENEDIIVKLPEEFKKIQTALKGQYKSRAVGLKIYGFTKPPSVINKTDLLSYQKSLQQSIKAGDFLAYRGVSEVAAMIKLNHALGLIETQTPKSLQDYFKKLEIETSKASKNILSNKQIQSAIRQTNKLVETNTLHPKTEKLKEIIDTELKKHKNTKTIIFANYRSTVNELKQVLEKIPNAKPTILIGQKKGFTQKEQISTIEKFNNHEFNILICTSIGEEGLSMGSLDLAIFYDHTASEIRKIQRSGRVARVRPGKIINLITEKTLDEAMLWTSKRKEAKMHNLLNYMKRNLESK